MQRSIREAGRRLRAPFNRRWAFRRLGEYHAAPRSIEETVDWALTFGGGGYFNISTIQVRSEILELARRVAELQPRVILEIGTHRGGTLLVWSALASKRVISCDLKDFTRGGELLRALPPPGSDCDVTLLSGNSHDPAFRDRVAAALDGEKVDFLFIDGDHTREGVAQDYRDYRDFVRTGGLIAFHDIVPRQALPTNQVHDFWTTIEDGPGAEEIVGDPDQTGFGIGVLRVA
jgi:cephalosporin hydroxylase